MRNRTNWDPKSTAPTIKNDQHASIFWVQKYPCISRNAFKVFLWEELRRLSIFTGRTKGTELNRLDKTQNTAVSGSRQRTLPNKDSPYSMRWAHLFRNFRAKSALSSCSGQIDAAQQREAASRRSDPRRGKELLDIGEHDDLLQLWIDFG